MKVRILAKHSAAAFLLLFVLTMAQREDQLTLGTASPAQSLDAGKSYYYSVTVPDNVATRSAYLIFDVFPVANDDSDPDIYMAETAFPSSGTQWGCSAYGEDICIIPKESVAPRKTFHATVFCQSACKFQLQVTLKAEYEISDGERVADHLAVDESRLYSFRVGADMNINEFTVSLNLGTVNKTNVQMFVTPTGETNTVPSQSNSILVKPTWIGLAGALSNTSDKFKRDYKYKVLVSSRVATSFVLQYKTNRGVVTIVDSGIDVYDYLGDGGRSCYQYDLADTSDSLVVYMKLYSGYANVYVNPGTIPEDLSRSKFVPSDGDSDEMLSISREDRHKAGADSGKYYICVFSDYYAAYNLLINMENPSSVRRLSLYPGLTRTLEVDRDKLTLFEYDIKEKVTTDFGFILTSITGDADLYVKFCLYTMDANGNPTNTCDLTKRDLDSPDVLSSTNTDSLDMVDTTFNPATCSMNRNVRCSYLVGVYGKRDSQFSISVLTSTDAETPIVDGVPFFGSVGLRQSTKFSFTVSNRRTSFLQIQLTSLSGDADLSVNRNDDYSKGSYRSTGQFDTVRYNRSADGDLTATYHITVYGYTRATFSIAYVSKYPGQPQPSSIDLYDGQPLTGTIAPSGDPALYSFGIAFAPNEAMDIRILVIPLSGSVSVYVGADYVPTDRNYTWSMDYGQTILIKANDKNYRAQGTYYVSIYTDDMWWYTYYSYTVKFVTGRFSTTLMEGVPEVGNMTQGDVMYYKYYINDLANDFTVSVTPYYGDPDLYISVNSSNQLPSYDQNDYMSAAYGADSISIPIADVLATNPECKASQVMGTECGIYVAVICSSDQCSFTLQLSKNSSSSNKLMDGMTQFGSVAGGRPIFYAFAPNSTNDRVLVYVQPETGHVKAYAKLISLSGRSSVSQSEMPSPDKNDFVSVSTANTEMLNIGKDAGSRCGPQCVYYIGVFVDSSYSMPGSSDSSDFIIVATTGAAMLSDGYVVTDQVEDKGYKYYYFYVGCSKCTLTVSVNPISQGDPDIYVNRGMDLPNRDNATFKSAGYRGDVLQISPDDEYLTANHLPVSGMYAIAVYGYHNCTYWISATTSSIVIQPLNLGVSVTNQQITGEIKYYGFTSTKASSIKVTLTMYTGQASIRANVINDDGSTNVTNSLPTNEAKSRWSSVRAGTSNYLQIQKDESGYLWNGTYLIGVEAADASNYAILVEYNNDSDYTYLISGESRRIHLKQGERSNLAFIVSTYDNVSIAAYTFYGTAQGTVSTDRRTPMWTFSSGDELVIPSTDRRFRTGTFYITLTATTECDLLVIGRTVAEFAVLMDGLPQPGSLVSQRTRYFEYYLDYNYDSSEYLLNIFVRFKKRVSNATLFVMPTDAYDPPLPNAQNSQTFVYDPMMNAIVGSITLNTTSASAVIFGVSAELSREMHSASFEVTAWARGVVVTTPGQSYMDSFTKPNDNQTYEVTVTSDQAKLFVEVTPCTGGVQFAVSRNFADLTAPSRDITKAQIKDGRISASYPVTRGTYYIVVQSMAPSKLEKKQRRQSGTIWYQMKTILTNSTTDYDPAVYSAGKDGRVTVTPGKDHELTLSWDEVVTRDTHMPVPGVEYSVYVAQRGDADMMTTCGIVSGNAVLLAGPMSDHQLKVNLKEVQRELSEKDVMFNVVAYIPDIDDTLAYMPTDQEGPHSGNFLWKLFILVLVIGAAFAIAYYIKRQKEQGGARVANASQPAPLVEQSELRDIGPTTQYHAQQDDSFN